MEEFATKFEFDLPKGYIDSAGTLHKHGVMRLATAADEILPLRDPRVIERLFSSDLAFLQNMYQRINAPEPVTETCVCPECGHKFEQPVNFTQAE